MSPKTEKSLLPPFLFPGKTASERLQLEKLKAQGLVYSIGPKIYTSISRAEVESVVRSSWALIASKLFPKARISHATALTYRPTERGEIFLTTNSQREIILPGITFKFMRGPAAVGSDVNFMEIKASSFERALLENLSSAKGSLSGRAVTQDFIESRLEEFLRTKGEAEFRQLRDRTRKISLKLRMKKEYNKLDGIIGALLGTRPQSNLKSENLKSENALARAQGIPFDPDCFGRLEILFGHLRHLPLREIHDSYRSPEHFLNKAFFDSYFSNYIEGTVFEVKEAERIIFDKVIPQTRPVDAHDILGTFKIVSDPNEMAKLPGNPGELIEILKSRHKTLLVKRLDIQPGNFKTKTNKAGNTLFVHPDYINGTLEKGFQLYHSLPEGLARAIFMMFLVSDIHPFNDGNGRISRIMMNSELFSTGLSSIIIPTVYREDYLLSLRALTRRSDPEPYVKMLTEAHGFSNLEFTSYNKIKSYLEAHNWFYEPTEARLIKN